MMRLIDAVISFLYDPTVFSFLFDPKDATAFFNRGFAWWKRDEFDKAIADFNEAIRLDPKLVDAYYFRGLIWEQKGDLDRAIADYSETIRLDPKLVDAYTNRGIAWDDKSQFDKAIADFNEAIRLDPKDAYAYFMLAQLQATCPDARYRDGAKAVKNAKKFFELTQREDRAEIDILAAAYAENGEFSEAVKWQEKAIELAPANEKADVRSHLELYKSGKPYRQKPQK